MQTNVTNLDHPLVYHHLTALRDAASDSEVF